MDDIKFLAARPGDWDDICKFMSIRAEMFRRINEKEMTSEHARNSAEKLYIKHGLHWHRVLGVMRHPSKMEVYRDWALQVGITASEEGFETWSAALAWRNTPAYDEPTRELIEMKRSMMGGRK